MLIGIGTDILNVNKIIDLGNNPTDAFYKTTFTEYEREQAARRSDPEIYFATRFAAKEAVFKCFGIDGNHIRLDEIEIITQATGAVEVQLHGKLHEIAQQKGVQSIRLSLSWDGDYALAFAVAEG